MARMPVAVLKFVGSISLGLLTGLSYTLSTITIPTLLTLPSASSASLAFPNLASRAVTDARVWTGVSVSSFLLAYVLSPCTRRHPYLLWVSLVILGSSTVDLLKPEGMKILRGSGVRDRKGKGKMEASYDVLNDGHSDTGSTNDEAEDDVNGEEVRAAMEEFGLIQSVRAVLAGTGFAMSIVGIWGDFA